MSVFVEDALRVITDWHDQLTYFTLRLYYPTVIAALGLVLNVVLQLAGSVLVLTGMRLTLGAYLLLADVPLQLFFYQNIGDLGFVLRYLSLCGGLFLLLSEAFNTRRSRNPFAGLPSFKEGVDATTYLQLAGRVLLVCLYLALTVRSGMSGLRLVLTGVGFVLSVLVVLGFKARVTATALVLAIAVVNPIAHAFWSLPQHDFRRDLVKYDFFISLSVMGGFMLLANIGPGTMSLDDRKKRID